ncbi:MAG: helix-turn-helix transcriptional regulator [Oscillospiraceae bacterium]|nr:helix-turn-helix transcriptional regulator [Oscillospiraceae bacterium]
MPDLLPLYNAPDYMDTHLVRVSTESIRTQDHTHFHRHIQICFVLSGELLHIIDGKEYLQSSGSLTFLPPYTSHGLSTVNSSDTPIIAHLWFHQSFLTDHGYNFFAYKDFAHFEGKKIPLTHIFPENANAAKSLVREMITVFERGNDFSYSHIASLIASLLRMSCAKSTCDFPPQKFLEHLNAVERSIDFISENYDKKISLDDMSRIAGIPRRFFTAVFKRVTGLTPLNFLISVRLYHATNLLAYTDLLFEDIAARTGLGNHATLSRAFSKYLGMTPTEYQKMRFLSRRPERIPVRKRFKWLTED